MSLFQPPAGEQVIFHCNGMWYKKKLMAYPGELHITAQRFVFEKRANPNSGLLVQLLMKSARAAMVFDVPLSSITRVIFRQKKALLGQIGRITIEYAGG